MAQKWYQIINPTGYYRHYDDKEKEYVYSKKDTFPQEIANQINADFPDQAKVEDGRVWIKKEHYKKCKEYVQKHCRIIG